MNNFPPKLAEAGNPTFEAAKFLQTAPQKPGVYRMYDAQQEILYVGKAKDLKKRLASYFRSEQQLTPKTRALVSRIAQIEVTVTHTETEALILENTLIKTHLPPYNILLRDDKSYPYIYLSADDFPRLRLHRGAKTDKGRYFGPYPSAKAVYQSLNLMQKLFPIRQCRDSFYRNRSRPCLQYQIKRCTAPCVGLISQAAYAEDVQHATLFLQGKSHTVIDQLVKKMQAAAQALEYEQAARYRDQINHLRQIQAHQYADTDSHQDIDIIACLSRDNVACVQVLSVRDGRHLGSRAYFPKQTQDTSEAEVLLAFLSQYYLGNERELPQEIIVNQSLEDTEALLAALKQQHGRSVRLDHKVRGARARWLEMAEENVNASLEQRKPTQYRERLTALSLALQRDTLPERMECFDISHTQGEATVAACVVFDGEGPSSSHYRRFNIKGIQAGDDYAAMKQALTRRYQKIKENDGIRRPELVEGMPDLLFIDGGKGQVKQALEVLEELQINEIQIIGVAKGSTRKAGLEHLILPDVEEPLYLSKDSPALHLIQHIRDESHRFAITGHRNRRAKARRVSVLEDIEGIGGKRRQQLIAHFGGLQGVQRAGVEDLTQVPGISQALAQKIYDALH